MADYLDAQGLAPYFAMGDRYGALYDRMVALMERIDPEDDPERRYERRLAVDELDVGTLATSWFASTHRRRRTVGSARCRFRPTSTRSSNCT